MTTQFENKEQYFTFRKAWATAVNSENVKPTLEKFSWGVERRPGWVQAEHHILFNILRGKPYYTGFVPVTCAKKLENCSKYVNHGVYWGMHKLESAVRHANAVLDENNKSWFKRLRDDKVKEPYAVRHVKSFLAPFNGTVTVEMLAALELPKVKPIRPDFAKGRKVAEYMIAHPKNYTYEEMLSIHEEVGK